MVCDTNEMYRTLKPAASKDQKKDGSGGREPLLPGMAVSFGFVLFVCHSAHLSVM